MAEEIEIEEGEEGEGEEGAKKEELSTIFECILNKQWIGMITHLGENEAEVVFNATKEMVIDTQGLVYSSFLLGVCQYTALAVINKENLYVQNIEAEYLAPVEVGSECIIKAIVKYKGDKKKIVLVQAFIKDIKIFEGTFFLIELEQHILDIKLNEEVE